MPIQGKLVDGEWAQRQEDEVPEEPTDELAEEEAESESVPTEGANETEPIAPEEEGEEEDENALLQTKQVGTTTEVGPNLEAQIHSLKDGGRPLSQAERSFFEPRFGHDFRQVRIHGSLHAATAARALNARAFTVGWDVAFGVRQYAPGTTTGRRLLAHELTHVVQQRCSPKIFSTSKPVLSSPGRLSEVEADRATREVTADLSFSVTQTAPAVISRAMLDVAEINKDIENGNKTHPDLFSWLHVMGDRSGEVGFGATKPKTRRRPDPAPSGDPNLPIKAFFFPSYIRHHDKRALIIGGIHGDERPSFEVADALVKELQTSTSPASKELFFHAFIVPRLNPGGIADNNRCNRQKVDLNRNFLYLRGRRLVKPTSKGGCKNTIKAPIQPETKAIIDVLRKFKPHRILSLHARGNPAKAGIFADPYKGRKARAARKLACSMAGLIVDPKNRRGNRLTPKRCNPVYRGGATGKTSLGAYTPTRTRLGEIVPVMTLEVPEKYSLASFKLTKFSLAALKKRIPNRKIFIKLNKLKDKEFTSRGRFITDLVATIGRAATNTYKSLIFKHAHRELKAFLPPLRGFISSPAKLFHP